MLFNFHTSAFFPPLSTQHFDAIFRKVVRENYTLVSDCAQSAFMWDLDLILYMCLFLKSSKC